MQILFVATSVLFFLWIIRNILYQVALWQLKEYRFDRVLVHLRETRQGRQLFFAPLSLIKTVLIGGYVFVVFNESYLPVYYWCIFLVYLISAVLVLRENFLNQQRIPTFTLKALFIFAVSIVILFAFYAVPLVDRFLWLLLIDKISYFIVALLVFGLSFPTEIFRDIQVNKAREKIKQFKKLLVIGVTGSYGKSSTKDYTAQILGAKFNVLKTQGTNNTPIGIAQTILRKLNRNTEIFVVEMGAYGRGEIAGMCTMVRPKIGILTAVNDQHLSLFGNLENTKRAKYELIESLPKDGIALFSGNNSHAFSLYNNTKKKKVLYEILTTETSKSASKPDIFANMIVVKKTDVAFDVHIGEKTMYLEAPLLGAHTIENILPGIYVADYLGMKEDEIKKAVSALTPLPKTMIYHKLQNGVTIIDDTFNANPDAVIAALNYAKIYRGKKILVLQPMIELGKKTNDEHYRVAKEIAQVCDDLILTNKNYFSSIKKGIADSGSTCNIEIASSTHAAEYLSSHTKKGDIIVFEGKEAAFVIEKML